ALRHWAIDPTKLVARERAGEVKTMLQAYQEQELQKYLKRRRRELTTDEPVPLLKQARRRLKYPKPVEPAIHSILDTDE
ncbi:MAG: hypothetical protein EBT15_10625, partial [Betaproteobacteria bacterium]|nr:hypothetical protein [Betaproteobacteria bacterium]